MIKHIVIFTFTEYECQAERTAAIAEIKQDLEALMGVVPGLKSIEVGININPKEVNNMVLITTFDSMDALNQYAIHPAHVAVGKKIGAIKTGRACVDFEF